MPLNLPGFYYDPRRNRYFPISSLPPGTTVPSVENQSALSPNSHIEDPGTSSSGPARKRQRTSITTIPTPKVSIKLSHSQRLRGATFPARSAPGISFASRSHIAHQVEAGAISRTRLCSQEELSLGPNCHITALAVQDDPDGYQVAGDNRGWLFIRQPSSQRAHGDGGPEENGVGYFDGTGVYISPTRWVCDIGLMSEITSIKLIRDRFFAASFGPHAKILVGALDAQEESDISAFILEPAKAYDVWTAVFESDGSTSSATLGLHNKALYIQDLDNRMSTRSLNTGSDVMTVCKKQNIVYTGERSGTVRLFDLRSGPGCAGSPLVKMNSMLTNVTISRDWEMIVAAAAGDMHSYDMRFMRTEDNKTRPLFEFEGHKNTYMHNLGFDVLPSGDFVVAAGIDRRVRAWSTCTGEQVTGPDSAAPDKLLNIAPAEGDILAVCASEHNLWCSCNRSVSRFEVGRQ